MSIYDLKIEKADGTMEPMSDFKDKVLLVINSATGCGFTPQYEAIEKLYEKYHDQGFEVLDFPCNQFGHQAPGTDDEIHEFCQLKYNTKFDQYKKIDVNGPEASELFVWLKENSPVETLNGIKNKMAMAAVKKMSSTCKEPNDIVWNFTKFLVDKNGNVVTRLSPVENPEQLDSQIQKLLEA